MALQLFATQGSTGKVPLAEKEMMSIAIDLLDRNYYQCVLELGLSIL